MKIPQSFIDIVNESKIEGNTLLLQTQLDRKGYVDFMKIAELLGLEWNRKMKLHVYNGEGDLKENLDEAIEQGEVIDLKKLFQQYYTPELLAKQAVDLADIVEDDNVLEPSAGQGAILKEILNFVSYCFYCEIDEKNREILKMINGAKSHGTDFLFCGDDMKFSKIVMNPPFSSSQDVKHILHAYSLLANGGRLVSIASSSIETRQGKLYDELQSLNPEFLQIDQGAFKESGTMVNSIFVILNK
jgi:hypothetical protein